MIVTKNPNYWAFDEKNPDHRIASRPAGGKGQSLTSLTAAGFAVSAGFTVSPSAYRQYLADNSLLRSPRAMPAKAGIFPKK